MRFYSSL